MRSSWRAAKPARAARRASVRRSRQAPPASNCRAVATASSAAPEGAAASVKAACMPPASSAGGTSGPSSRSSAAVSVPPFGRRRKPWRSTSQCTAPGRFASAVTDITCAGSCGRICSTVARAGQPAAPTMICAGFSASAHFALPAAGGGASRQAAPSHSLAAVAPSPPSSSASAASVTRSRSSARDATKLAVHAEHGRAGRHLVGHGQPSGLGRRATRASRRAHGSR